MFVDVGVKVFYISREPLHLSADCCGAGEGGRVVPIPILHLHDELALQVVHFLLDLRRLPGKVLLLPQRTRGGENLAHKGGHCSLKTLTYLTYIRNDITEALYVTGTHHPPPTRRGLPL